MSKKNKGKSSATDKNKSKKGQVKAKAKTPSKKPSGTKTKSKTPAKKAIKKVVKARPVPKKSPAPKKPVAKAKTAKPKKPLVKSASSKPKTSGSSKAAKTKNQTGKSKASPVKTTKQPASKSNTGKSSSKAPSAKQVKPANQKGTASGKSDSKSKTELRAEQEEKQRKFEEIFSRKKTSSRKNPEVLAISNTIPEKKKNDISPSRIASISSSITNPSKRTDSYAVKVEKEPPGKFELEFIVHASAEMLFEFISTPSGLSEWFCDDLNIRNGIYTFIWDDQLQQARLLKTVDLQLVRFQWVEKTDGSYFEFKVQRDDLTNDISLIITDFSDSVSDRESAKLLWHSQVEKLMQVLGSIY